MKDDTRLFNGVGKRMSEIIASLELCACSSSPIPKCTSLDNSSSTMIDRKLQRSFWRNLWSGDGWSTRILIMLVIMPKKEKDEWRLVVDYRGFNRQIESS